MFTARGKRSVFAVGLVAAAALALSACSSSNPLDEPSDSGDSSGSGVDALVFGEGARRRLLRRIDDWVSTEGRRQHGADTR